MKYINDTLTAMTEAVKKCYPEVFKKIKYVGFVPTPFQIILLNDGNYILNCPIGPNEGVLEAFVNLIVFDMNKNSNISGGNSWQEECSVVESHIIDETNFIVANLARKASSYIDKIGIVNTLEDSKNDNTDYKEEDTEEDSLKEDLLQVIV